MRIAFVGLVSFYTELGEPAGGLASGPSGT